MRAAPHERIRRRDKGDHCNSNGDYEKISERGREGEREGEDRVGSYLEDSFH
jgi:hypothetical protein